MSCQLHNISSERVCLTCSEGFAVIEFQKDDAICAGRFVTSRDKRASELRTTLGESKRLEGIMGYPCLTFPSRSLGREPVNKETDEEIPEEGEYRINEPIKKGHSVI